MTIEVDCVLKIMMWKSFRPVSILLLTFSSENALHKIMIGEYRIKIGRVPRSFVFYCYTLSLTRVRRCAANSGAPAWSFRATSRDNRQDGDTVFS